GDEREDTAPGSTKQRVLIVDDNRDGAESLAIMLRLWGHKVFVAFDGPSALVAALQHAPEFIILDIGLPGMDGYEVAQQLRQQAADARVLVALTGYGQEEARRRAIDSGFDHHLLKPVNPDELQRLLSQPAAEPAGAM